MIRVGPLVGPAQMDWGTDSLCLSKKMSFQGVVGSLSPYMETFSGAWLQACVAAASTLWFLSLAVVLPEMGKGIYRCPELCWSVTFCT